MIIYDYEMISSAAAIIYELGVSVLQLLCYDFYDMTFMTVALALVVGPPPTDRWSRGAEGFLNRRSGCSCGWVESILSPVGGTSNLY